MAKTANGLTVAVPVKTTESDETRVPIFIPLNEDDESGMKVDPFDHISINDVETLVMRGQHVDVTVPVFLQLRNKYPHL